MLQIQIQVADHDDAALGADAVLAAGELAGLHVALEDVHTVLLVEGDAGDFIEAHQIVLTDQPALAGGVVDEHFGHRGLAAGDQVGVGGDLLKQMALAGAARPQLHQVVVSLHEGRHANQRDQLRPWRQRLRRQPDAAQQEALPLIGAELAPAALQPLQQIRFGELDGAQGVYRKGPSVLLLGDGGVVA